MSRTLNIVPTLYGTGFAAVQALAWAAHIAGLCVVVWMLTERTP